MHGFAAPIVHTERSGREKEAPALNSAKGKVSATVLAALMILAVVQSLALADRLTIDRAGYISTGDDLSTLRVGDDAARRLPLDGPLLLLVFDPACAHSRPLASGWIRLLHEAAMPAQILAVAPGSFEAAARFVRTHGWQVPLATVERPRPGSREHALVSRTPWVFAVHDGRVVAHGHGDDLAEVAAALPPRPVTSSGARARFATVPEQ